MNSPSNKTEQAAHYARDPETRGKDAPYEEKFGNLIKLCKTAKATGVRIVIIAFPWVLGDTYEEVIESLTRLSEAGLAIHIVPKDMESAFLRVEHN